MLKEKVPLYIFIQIEANFDQSLVRGFVTKKETSARVPNYPLLSEFSLSKR